MFDFEKFKAHKKAEDYCLNVRNEIRKTKSLARFERDQLGRCSLSVVANIDEGNSIIKESQEPTSSKWLEGHWLKVLRLSDFFR